MLLPVKPISTAVTSLKWRSPSIKGFVQCVHNTALSVSYKKRAGWPFVNLLFKPKANIRYLLSKEIHYSLCDFRLPPLLS